MLKNIITCIINMIMSRKRIFRSSFSKQKKYRKITINIPKFRKFITNFQKTVKLRKLGNLGPLGGLGLLYVVVCKVKCQCNSQGNQVGFEQMLKLWMNL